VCGKSSSLHFVPIDAGHNLLPLAALTALTRTQVNQAELTVMVSDPELSMREDGDNDDKKTKKKKDKKKKEKKEKKSRDTERDAAVSGDDEKKRLKAEKKKLKKDEKKSKKKDKKKIEEAGSHSDIVDQHADKEPKTNGSADVASEPSASRYYMIDPNKEAPRSPFLKAKAPLPRFTETPDWMFKPDESKGKPFGLGIADKLADERKQERQRSIRQTSVSNRVPDEFVASAESVKFAKEFKAKLQTDKVLKQKLLFDTKEISPKDQLLMYINHDPWTNHKTPIYDDDLTYDLILKNPRVCRKKYSFDFAKDKLYPFSVLCALGASERTLSECYKAYPHAAAWNDGFIGTPMHYACSYRAPMEVIKFLIEEVRVDDESSSSSGSSQGSDDGDKNSMIWSTNHMFRLPIHLACMAQAPIEILKLLIDEYKQGLARVDKDGMTPLHYACDHADANLEVVDMLAIKYKKAVITKNKTHGQTPLHLAVSRGCRLEIVEALFLSEPDRILAVADKKGNLPLHTAILSSADMKIIQFLVWNYADGLTVYNAKNERPIDIAKRLQWKNKDLAEILDPLE
jgi:ankyrin repeat protein